MSEQEHRSEGCAESLEQELLRRRKLLEKGVILGVPLILTLSGRAFAAATSGAMSGNMSGQAEPDPWADSEQAGDNSD